MPPLIRALRSARTSEERHDHVACAGCPCGCTSPGTDPCPKSEPRHKYSKLPSPPQPASMTQTHGPVPGDVGLRPEFMRVPTLHPLGHAAAHTCASLGQDVGGTARSCCVCRVPVRRYVPGDGPVPEIQTVAQILQIPQPTPTHVPDADARACPRGCRVTTRTLSQSRPQLVYKIHEILRNALRPPWVPPQSSNARLGALIGGNRIPRSSLEVPGCYRLQQFPRPGPSAQAGSRLYCGCCFRPS